MTRPVKRLYDLEIDEISLVDRPANQHGVVAIAKRAEGTMGIFDPDGNPVDEDSLEPGDKVYDEEGTEYVYVENDADGSEETEDSYEDEREYASVGKSAVTAFRRGFKNPGGVGFMRNADGGNNALHAGAHVGRNKGKYAGGAAAATLGVGYGGGRMSKGLGESVYEALSKALNDDDRDQVISKIAREVEVTKAENLQLQEILEAVLDDRSDQQYLEIAKSYNLPVDESRLANILKSAASVMSQDELDDLDRLLTSQSEIYDELGTAGSLATSQIMDQVEAMALETVGKADISVEQATVALFEANPAAYDEYLQEG